MKTCPTCQSTYPDDFSLCPRDGAPLTAQTTETEAQLAAGLSRRFHIIRRLGQGGMGTVFLAEQIGVGNRPVALKVLNRKLLDDPDFLLRFQHEAGSTGRIHHPNVVTIHESAQGDDGTPYIAMEFLEGESLREVLQRRGALPVTEVAEILQQAARGLNAAHKLGIIHRDLKPDNLFLTKGDEGELIVKVVDFGIAKLRESATHTPTGTVLGTPAYMSYEQASGMKSDDLDARSDIYSLGVVVYEMLTGRTPFHSDTDIGYLRKHMQEEPPPFRVVAPGVQVPPRVEVVVMKALKKEREERYRSVLEFGQAFVAAALPAPAADVSQPLPTTMVVLLPTPHELDVAEPRPFTTPGQSDAAVQTPAPAPPERIVETERAWLIARMQQELIPSVVQFGSAVVNVINVVCTIKNYGKTPAWVTALGLKRHLVENGQALPDEPNYKNKDEEQEQPRGEVILPPGESIKQIVRLLPPQVADVRTKKLTLYVYGYIRYRDAFGQGRQTKFCYEYRVPIGVDLRPEGFYEGGPSSYTSQT